MDVCVRTRLASPNPPLLFFSVDAPPSAKHRRRTPLPP